MGNRPRLLAQCKKYIIRQTIAPHSVWIENSPQTIFPCDLTWRFRQGIKQLLSTGVDLIVCMEDDDWYPYNYLESFVNALHAVGNPVTEPEILGFEQSLYYHIIRQEFRRLIHPGRSSLMCTGLTTAAAARIVYPPDDHLFLDLKLWEQFERKLFVTFDSKIPVGIKHGFGQCGGAGHHKTFRYDHKDKYWESLALLVGDDVEFYQRIARDRTP